jgi:hypothetical protein
MHSLGYTRPEILADAYVSDVWIDADFVEWADFEASPETYCTVSSGNTSDPNEFWAAENIVVVQPAGLYDLPGTGRYIEIDFERQDGVTEAQTTAFVTHLAGLCHAKGQKLIIWPNTLNNTGAIYSGLSAANLNTIHTVADGLSFLLYDDGGGESRVEQAQACWDLVEAGGDVDPDKILISISLSTFTVQDARDLFRWMRKKGITQIKFWRQGATQTGTCDTEVNRIIATFLGVNVPKPGSNILVF